MGINPFPNTMSNASYAKIHDNYLRPPEPEDSGWEERSAELDFECDADVAVPSAETGFEVTECDFSATVEGEINWTGELVVECPKCGSESIFQAEEFGFAPDSEDDL